MSKQSQRRSQITLPVLAVSLIIGLAACDSNEKKPASQVVAKVNSDEISVHQINYVLGRSNTSAITPEQAPAARREVLDKLIDQQLVVEQALEKKLDHSPEVLMALEAGRREILARAYLGQIAAAQTRPTDQEAKKYIAEHPPLFVERRIFNIQEIILPAASNVTPALRDMLAAGKSMDEIASWLRSRNIKFTGGSATRPAEQITLELLPRVHALKDGQGLVLENTQNVTVMRLVASQSAPIDESTALPRVRQYLGNQRSNEAVLNELSQLKARAKITYLGEFGKETSASQAAPLVPAAFPDNGKASIEKGVAGIK